MRSMLTTISEQHKIKALNGAVLIHIQVFQARVRRFGVSIALQAHTLSTKLETLFVMKPLELVGVVS